MIKIQDLAFFLLFVFLLWRGSVRLAVIMGLTFLILAIPLFKFWIFFTAERLTWYAAGFFAYAIIRQYLAIFGK